MKAALLSLFRRCERVIRYILVGGGVTLFYSLVTVGLVSGHVCNDPTLASAIAQLVTFPLSFLAHRTFTYADVAPDAAQWQRFAVIAASNFVITTSVMKSVDLLGWPYWIALIVGWVLIPFVNYTINAIWVFRARSFLGLSKQTPPD